MGKGPAHMARLAASHRRLLVPSQVQVEHKLPPIELVIPEELANNISHFFNNLDCATTQANCIHHLRPTCHELTDSVSRFLDKSPLGNKQTVSDLVSQKSRE